MSCGYLFGRIKKKKNNPWRIMLHNTARNLHLFISFIPDSSSIYTDKISSCLNFIFTVFAGELIVFNPSSICLWDILVLYVWKGRGNVVPCQILSSVCWHVSGQRSHLSAVVSAPWEQQRGWDVTRIPDNINTMYMAKGIRDKCVLIPKRGWKLCKLYWVTSH